MSLDPKLRDSLTLPAICAPMFLVTGPDLVREACKAGVIGGLPRQNARTLEEFEGWLAQINDALAAHRDQHPGARIAPIAVNYPTRMAPDDLAANMAVCAKYGVEIIISVGGDPSELVNMLEPMAWATDNSFVICGIKKISDTKIGDTLTDETTRLLTQPVTSLIPQQRDPSS